MPVKKKAKKIFKLTFPQRLIKKPLTFQMAKKYDIIPNIRRARVTRTVGELVLELTGEKDLIEKGIKYLKKSGVKIEPVEGNVIE